MAQRKQQSNNGALLIGLLGLGFLGYKYLNNPANNSGSGSGAGTGTNPGGTRTGGLMMPEEPERVSGSNLSTAPVVASEDKYIYEPGTGTFDSETVKEPILKAQQDAYASATGSYLALKEAAVFEA